MSSTSGVLIVPYQDTNYRLDNLAFSNVKTFENIVINRFFQLEPTGFNISGGSVPLSGFGATEIRTEILGEQCFRKNVITSNSLSGYVDIEFKWDSLNSQNQIVNFDRDEITSNTVNGYKVKIYDKYNNQLLKNYNLSTFTTGFNSTGLSGFAGDNTFTGYFFTGASGFAGASGVTGNGLTGQFNYVLVDTGANAYGLVESGFLVTQNTYIPISGTGGSTIFGLKESGFNVTESGFNRNEFTFPAADQYEIFTGENADFNLHVQNTTIGGVDFQLTKRFKVIQPEIDEIIISEINQDVVNFVVKSESSTFVSVTGNINNDEISNASTDSKFVDIGNENNEFNFELSHVPNKSGRFVISPNDQYSKGNSIQTGFINDVFLSGLSISEVNVGTDPGIRLNWNIFDRISNETFSERAIDQQYINSYYPQKIQIFDPNRDGNSTKFDFEQEPYFEYSPELGVVISGGTGFGHGLIQYAVTGFPSGFAGESGVTGNGLSGLLTYEAVSEEFLESGISGAFGIVESGFEILDFLITKPLSESIFDYQDLITTSFLSGSGNLIDISLKDCNIDSSQVGAFIWVNTSGNDTFITGQFITGSVLRDYFINQSGFGLNTNGPYNINLSLGSGNSIQSSKSSPGEMKFISTDEQDESLDLMFANTSGFGTALTGNVEISLGESNKIVSDGGGNIDFKSVSTGEAQEETSLFNITSDPDIPSVFKSDLEIHMPETGFNITGHKLFFGTNSQNTDPIYFTRLDTESDDSELRLYLGDNHGDSSNYDKFLVGGVTYPSEVLNTILSVTTQNTTGAVGILTDSPVFPFHVKSSVPSSDNLYIASIDNQNTDGGGLWLNVSDNDNDQDALRISNPYTTENLLRIKSQSGVFIAYDQLPAADPGAKGQLYRDSNNFLKISAG